MKSKILTFMAALTVTLSLSACGKEQKVAGELPDEPVEPVENTPGKVVVAYVTSWTSVLPNPDRITHINYAFGGVAKDFSTLEIDNLTRLESLVKLKSNSPKLKICLSVGGWGRGNFSEMAASDKYRKAFAEDCAKKVKSLNIDGIDIDWEFPTNSSAGISSSPDDKANFTLLMKDLRAALGKGKLLTLATVCSAQYIDFKGILPYIDFVNIMAYDMASAPYHNAPLYRKDADGKTSPYVGYMTVDESVEAHLNAGVPADMLVLGMPFYGHGNGKDYDGYVDYRDNKGPKASHQELWDEIARVPYYANARGELLLGFDNVRSIREKCNYIKEKGLKGGMYWDYGADNDAGDLSRAVASVLISK
mgnify:FL=1